jgi:hypothetical protein
VPPRKTQENRIDSYLSWCFSASSFAPSRVADQTNPKELCQRSLPRETVLQRIVDLLLRFTVIHALGLGFTLQQGGFYKGKLIRSWLDLKPDPIAF